MASTLEFAIGLNAVFSGSEQFGQFSKSMTQAQNNLGKLQQAAQSLQKTSGNINAFQKLEGQIQANTTAMNTAKLEAQQAAEKAQLLQAQSATLSDQHSQATTRVQELSAKLSVNAAEYIKNSEQLEALTAAGKQNTAEYQQAQQAAERLAMQERSLSREFRTASQQEKTLARSIKTTDQEAARLTAEEQKLTQQAAKLDTGIKNDTQRLEEMRAGLNASGVNTAKLTEEQQKLENQLSRVNQAQQRVTEAQSKYNNLKQSVSWNNIKGDVMSSMGIIKSFEVPVKTMMDFEQAMANVRAVNGANDTDFAMLRDQALELGRTTQFSASQAANTQESLARGGFDPQQIKNAMPAVLAMAAAEGMDLAAAGDIVVKTLGGMGYKDEKGNVDATQSARVADVLANMSASSATNITELGEGMKIAAPVMSQLGVSIEQLGAYLGGMANKGFVGSEAGNALASSAMRLSKLPSDTKKALNDLGVATRTKSGKMREFPDIMKALNEAFNKRNFGEAQRMDYLAKIFGTGQGKAMLGFMDAAVSGQIDTLEVSNKTQAQGKSQAMADVRNNTLVGDLAGLSSAWEGFMISVGKPLEDWTRNIVQGLTQAISWVTQLMKEHEGLADVIVKVVAGLGALKVGFTVYNISKNVTGLVGAFFQLKSASSAATAAMQGASSAGGVFSSLGSMVKSVWGVIMAHPFVAIGAAVGAAAILIYQNWDTIKEKAAICWNAIKDYASSASQWAKDKFQSLANWWNSWSLADIFSPLSGYADSAAQWAKDKWLSVQDWFNSWSLPDVFASLSDFASNSINSIKGLFSGLGDWIMNTIGKLNPFNWEMPSWLGGGQTKEQKQEYHNRGQDALQSAFGAPSFEIHAKGGIMTKPHLGLVAEDGPEAIIPLSDKSRGVDVLMQAADLLGVSFSQPNISLQANNNNSLDNMLSSFERSNDFVRNYNQSTMGLYSGSNPRGYSGQPQINITVNSSASNDNDGLADMIARKVQEVLQDIQERNERLAYA